MPGVDEFGLRAGPDSRVMDSTNITDNESLLMRQFIGLLGLDVDRDGKLYRRKMVFDGVEHSSRPMMTYQGAVRLVQETLPGYLSNLGSYTHLTEERCRTITKDFNENLAYWLWSNRERYEIEEADCYFLSARMSDLVYMQLSRSVGRENMIVQVMGNTQTQRVYQSRVDEQGYDQPVVQPQRRGFLGLGGMFSR
jgi:hypothetical protein